MSISKLKGVPSLPVAALPVLLVYGLVQRQLREGLTVGVGK